ncbi:hypothetical protein ESA94_14805 [Lacibacter luteus]|uniref:Lipocalin-like domain-containing protein n=1 Tax=Lacibacter luteus TaxID=2508719 RepID=A0A4Q1CGV8_9BACT|nr:hypothetical protein [Lacibacter luteus]RXK59400.1 hypothetical protein ESA94_14805 [Lacibacter luteus]
MLLRLSLYTVLFVCMVSCKKETTTNNNVDLQSGTWRINYYWDTKDETSSFTSYIFMFNSGGSIMAHTSTSMVTGTWSETATKLTLNFGSDPVLSGLNGDWLKTEKTTTSLKLKDDNAGQDDKVYFVKN